MAKETPSDFYPTPIVDQDQRPGVIVRLLIFVVVLVGASIVFALFRERLGDPFLLGMLGVLAMVGVGYLFATAVGFVQVAPRSTNDELAKAFADSMVQGLLVTDLKGRIVYANRAYAEMTGAGTAADVKTVEALLSDLPEASPTVFRLATAVKDGQAGAGESRLMQPIQHGAVQRRPLAIRHDDLGILHALHGLVDKGTRCPRGFRVSPRTAATN